MGVNTGMNQALLGNNPLATIQGVWEKQRWGREKRQEKFTHDPADSLNATFKAQSTLFYFIHSLEKVSASQDK